MMETIHGLKRTKYCGQFTMADAGQKAIVFGWVQRQRDLGQLIFIDLRDRTGIVQLAFDDHTDRAVFDKAFAVRAEYVLAAVGTVRERSSKNMELPTGEVELFVEELRVLNAAETPPFEILDETTAKEDVRLKYRYLDLRRPILQESILKRANIMRATRRYFDENGFIEIDTPVLMKSTPEGARDFLVPSRLHAGSFYALPQSPQLYKQILMVSGFDRYYQLAKCFRDEDARADRQPEFTQLDVEMSFVEQEDVLRMTEGYIQYLFKQVQGVELPQPLPRMTYQEAMERFGTDKPDTRYEMEIKDLTETVRGSGFGVFANAIAGGGSVRAITAKQAAAILTRKEIDKLTEYIRGIGGKGIAWVRMLPEGPASSFAKFLSEEEMSALLSAAGAETGDVVLIIADTKTKQVLTQLGALRTVVAKKLDIIPSGRYHFVWIVEMPFFEFDDELGEWVAMHHAFTSPMEECLPYLETDKANVRAQSYDLVLNGFETLSGSIRITDPELQGRVFKLLGFSKEEAQEKFGFLLDAFKYGAPPHGGIGLGIDRLAMIMSGRENLRDVVAFPKVASMAELMTDAPSAVYDEQLAELGIRLVQEKE